MREVPVRFASLLCRLPRRRFDERVCLHVYSLPMWWAKLAVKTKRLSAHGHPYGSFACVLRKCRNVTDPSPLIVILTGTDADAL